MERGDNEGREKGIMRERRDNEGGRMREEGE